MPAGELVAFLHADVSGLLRGRGVKRTELSLLEGVDPEEACRRCLRVY